MINNLIINHNINMEGYRHAEKNKILNEVASVRAKIERSKNAIDSLRKNTMIRDKEFLEKKMDENKELIESLNEKLEWLQERICQVENGELDDELSEKVQQNMDDIYQKVDSAKKKKAFVKKKMEKKTAEAVSFHKRQKDNDYQKKRQYYDMLREYERFCDLDIPPYISENLKDMPNNKGYIWKGVWCFGERPRQHDEECTMFEKQRAIMYIHEIDKNEHVIFKKVGKDPKELHSRVSRRIIKKPF